MPSAMPPPDADRHPRPCGEPGPIPSTSSGGPVQPMNIQSFNNSTISSSPSPLNTLFSASHPVSAFSSSSSSEGDVDFSTSTSSVDRRQSAGLENYQRPIIPPLAAVDLSSQCQDIFSFEWGAPASSLGDLNSALSGPTMGFGDLNHALAGLYLGDNSSNGSLINGNLNVNGQPNLNGTNWSSSQSIANLPHLLTPSAANYTASLPPTCYLCTLPIPRFPNPMPTFSIYTITSTNPLHHSIFILTSTPSCYSPDSGLYLYLSSTDLYFHAHPGPLPDQLPGFGTETYVGRIRNDADPMIWLPTGAGGQDQDWLWTFRDMCTNMRMPPRDTPGWREMFKEEDWVASVVGLGKAHGIVVGGEE